MRTGSTAGISFIYCSNRLKKASEGFFGKGECMEKVQSAGNSDGHKLIMDARKEAKITGVEKVISFEPDLVYLLTKAGKMKLTGKDMHMTNLDIDKGILDMNGKVDCVCYMTDKEDGTFSLKRLFK